MSINVSTASLYQNQTNNILDQSALLQKYTNELSTGLTLNQPSDNPIAISQYLQLQADVAGNNTLAQNTQIASNQLTSVDGSLSSLTDILQQARSIAVEASSTVNSQADLTSYANQVQALFNTAVDMANTQFNGRYVFAGTAQTTSGPVTIVGAPPSGVNITANNQIISEQFGPQTTLPLTTSLQDAFNVGAANGSPDVFSTLLALRDTLNNASISIQSQGAINSPGSAILNSTVLGAANFAAALKPDSSGNYAVQIAGPGGTQTLTFTAATTVGGIAAAINASSTGVTAQYNQKTGLFSLSSTGTFSINDVPSAGATTSANLVEALGLPTQGNVTQSVSSQLGNIDNVLNVALAARSSIGASIQTLSTLESNANLTATNDTASASTLADANVPQVSTSFELAKTALQAAYMATSRVEGTMLFDYLPAS